MASTPALDVVEEVRLTTKMPTPKMARALREAAGLSQGRIADALGVSRVAVGRWEGGLRKPRAKNRRAYAALLAALAAEVNGS